jgi:hypothetical protein
MDKSHQEIIFDIAIILHYVLLVIFILGINGDAKQYWTTVCYYIKLYISFFLLIRFNGFRSNIKFTAFDRKIVFNAGAFLLFTTLLDNVLVNYAPLVQKWVNNIKKHFV